jgi:cytochrome c-type biogenesis protein CcmH/NrfF
MSTLPLWAWVAGTIVLGAVIAYGILKNRTRTPEQRIISNEATKELYRQENQREARSEAGARK